MDVFFTIALLKLHIEALESFHKKLSKQKGTKAYFKAIEVEQEISRVKLALEAME